MYKFVAVNTSSDASRGTGQVAGGSSWCCKDSVISDETMSGECVMSECLFVSRVILSCHELTSFW